MLGAGFLHALWNALLKSSAGDPLLDTALIVVGSCVVCVPLLPFVPIPAAAAWPFLLASMVDPLRYYFGCWPAPTGAATCRSRTR